MDLLLQTASSLIYKMYNCFKTEHFKVVRLVPEKTLDVIVPYEHISCSFTKFCNGVGVYVTMR